MHASSVQFGRPEVTVYKEELIFFTFHENIYQAVFQFSLTDLTLFLHLIIIVCDVHNSMSFTSLITLRVCELKSTTYL